jgi:plastocyanin
MKTILSIASGALAFFAVSASATDYQVSALTSPNRYEPNELTIAPGDTVTFTNMGGFHNVESDADSVTAFRCADGCDGDGGDGTPAGPGWTATVTFPDVGVAGFHCEVHGVAMSGTITIQNDTGAPVVDVSTTPIDASAQEGAIAVVPLAIGNTGTADLDWNVDESLSADCSTADDVPWLSLDPASGTVATGADAASVNVTFDATTLDAGLYNASVCVHSNDTDNPLVAVAVAFTVSADDTVFKDGFDPPAM